MTYDKNPNNSLIHDDIKIKEENIHTDNNKEIE